MRFILRTLILISALILALAGAAYLRSGAMLRTTYPVPADGLTVPFDQASLARGEHLVQAVGACTVCHGPDLGGAVYAEMGPVGIVAGPNLTRGRGGIGGQRTVADLVRSIRFGVRRDGTSLLMMPSEIYTNLTDPDLASIVTYLAALPPVDREVPVSRLAFFGRVLMGAGRLDLLVAPKTRPPLSRVATVEVDATVEHGRYIADVSGCHGCHGRGLSGGVVAGPPGLPLAANLTPAGLGAWTERDFVTAMRDGRRPDGTAIDTFMPWQSYRAMNDAELGALWRYLASVPPKPSGGK